MGLFGMLETEIKNREVTGVTEVTSPKSLGKRSYKTANDEVTEVTSPESLEKFREGPPYPDGRGRVKCAYCALLGALDVCQQTGRRVRDGISLLRECDSFRQKGEANR